ncbi:MAG: prephenate dehydrogenase/arogenate dehydrogenase family protein [Thermoplasmatota archaeon]
MTDDLAKLREEIRAIDREVVRLAAKRTALARRVGEMKRASGEAIRNYAVEAEVIRDARAAAAAEGFSPDVAEEEVKLLIHESLAAQERDRRRASRPAHGSAGRALVVGGRGRMGAWFAEFFASKGYEVSVADPRGALEGFAHVEDTPRAAKDQDVVLVATPPSAVNDVLASVEGRTDALTFEIASLKSPFIPSLRRLAGSGMNVTSVHPMWGPGADMLADRNVVFCDAGRAKATDAARDLFADTAARIVDVPLEEHDAFMAYTLGLPHALNLAFGAILARSPFTYEDIAHLGGPTFANQVRVAREVASESPDLYYEIQKLNVHTPEVYDAIEEAVARLEGTLGARADFVTFMKQARTYFEDAR